MGFLTPLVSVYNSCCKRKTLRNKLCKNNNNNNNKTNERKPESILGEESRSTCEPMANAYPLFCCIVLPTGSRGLAGNGSFWSHFLFAMSVYISQSWYRKTGWTGKACGFYLSRFSSLPLVLSPSFSFLFFMSAVAMVERWKIFLLFIVKCPLWGRNQEKEKRITWLHTLTVAR